jgi:hypothetical protein
MNRRVNEVRDASQKYGRIIGLILVTGIAMTSIRHVDDCVEYLFIYRLLNDAVSTPDYIVLSCKAISEHIFLEGLRKTMNNPTKNNL